MTNVVTPTPTPVFNNPDGAGFPESAADGWTVQSAANGSDQNLVSGL